RKAAVDDVDEVADVDGHEHVGLGPLALGGDALGEALLHEDRVDGDAGLGGEGVEERPDQARLAGGVEVDLGGRGHRAQRQHPRDSERNPSRHPILPDPGPGKAGTRDEKQALRHCFITVIICGRMSFQGAF
ncbi:hypothetical protein QU38_00440, partial [Staphylococcus aureus]